MKTGQKAPAFRLQDETGELISLDDYKGGRLAVFFFQKAKSPGCAVTAGGFRDAFAALRSLGVSVVGISPDTWRRHGKFRAAEKLPFRLLSDKDAAACQAYGIWQEKVFYGKHYMGVARSAFLIGADGRLEQEWRDVHYEGQAALVLAWLRGEPEPVMKTPSGRSAAGKTTVTTKPARRPAAKRK